MKEELMVLRNLRDNLATLKEEKKAKYEQFLKDNEQLFTNIEQNTDLMSETIDKIDVCALRIYKETGNKTLDYGVGIRVMKRFEYDELDAFKWAKEHSLALSLDKKAFEKIAKVDTMDFVKINEIPQATIPTNIKLED